MEVHQHLCLPTVQRLFSVELMALGKQIAFYRNKLRLTLEELSELSHVDVGTIHALEKRDSQRSKYASAIAKGLGLSTERLLEEGVDWLEQGQAGHDYRVVQSSASLAPVVTTKVALAHLAERLDRLPNDRRETVSYMLAGFAKNPHANEDIAASIAGILDGQYSVEAKQISAT